MNVAEYIEHNQKALPPELAEMIAQSTSIWTNDACYGYCIAALENAGCGRSEIEAMIHHLHCAFDELTVEEAETKWIKW